MRLIGRNHDVFVIGEEHLPGDATDPEAPIAPGDDQEPGGHPQPPRLGRPTPPPGRFGPRGLAVLAIAGAGAATGVALGSALHSVGSRDHLTSSSRSGPAAPPAPRAAAPPLSARRHLLTHRTPEPRHPRRRAPARGVPTTEAAEPEREPTPPPAPESSPPPVEYPEPAPVAAAAPAPPAPSPPPPPSGGGRSGTEDFGFER